MKINNIGFTGRMIAIGPIKEQEFITNKIYEHLSPKGINSDWDTINETKRLYATGDDVKLLNELQREQSEAIMASVKKAKASEKQGLGNFNPSITARYASNKFYKENIIKINPKNIYTTSQVIHAINNKLFDFVNLVIKNFN